ncbi:MAG: hypothetical protein FD167_3777 [bacterium]|nr:MAG: hypothetical protein FD167_3777 [bacterium]
MMLYWLIEILIVIWMVLITILNQQLTNKYPVGLSRKQAQNNSSRVFFYLTISLILCGLIYFSAWVANWSSRLAIPNYSNSPYFTNQLADLISIINFTISGSIITLVFSRQKRNLFVYKNLFGLADILPECSLRIITSLPRSKQKAFAERLSWLIERVEKKDPFQLTILFDKDELIILAKIFSQANFNQLDSCLAPIYQEVTQLNTNPKPFSIIL